MVQQHQLTGSSVAMKTLQAPRDYDLVHFLFMEVLV